MLLGPMVYGQSIKLSLSFCVLLLFSPKVIEIVNKMKEERDKILRDRAGGQWLYQVVVRNDRLGTFMHWSADIIHNNCWLLEMDRQT